MPDVEFAELLLWLLTVAVYVAIPVAAFLLLRRVFGARRTRR